MSQEVFPHLSIAFDALNFNDVNAGSQIILVPLQLSSYQDEGHWYRLPLINFSQYYLVATVLASH